MKILITGARGDISLALVPSLLREQNELVLLDPEPMLAPEGCVSVQADICDAAAVTYAMQGCQAVIHMAAYQADYTDFRNENDFYSVNVTGTHNVLRAMQLHDIHHLIFTSTDQIYGEGLRGTHLIDEDLPCVPTHIFGQTKWLSEELCRYASRAHNFRIAILRCGDSAPTDWKTAGLAKLNNGVDREDVAQAHELALAAVLAEEFRCETFLIESAKRFELNDWPELQFDPAPIVERYYPGATDLLEQHNLPVPRVHYRYDISKAVNQLGYEPQHNFDQFLSRLKHA